MKLIFIRHGDPDYSIDSLTEKGWREAELLSDRVSKWDISEIYCSPLGRAKDTASLSLKKLGKEATIYEWLKEFYYPVIHKEDNREHVPWDFYPEIWTQYENAFDKDEWYKNPLIPNPSIKPAYDEVCNGLDMILSKHGYVRKGRFYTSDGTGENDTIVFFCHLGVIMVMLSHLLSISPFLLWHDFFIAPTSVTVAGAEERDPGKAFFRVQVMGDTKHLTEHGEPVSKAGYFTDAFQG